jgi:hypothetical protein
VPGCRWLAPLSEYSQHKLRGSIKKNKPDGLFKFKKMLLNSDLGIPGWPAPQENAAGTRGYVRCCIPASMAWMSGHAGDPVREACTVPLRVSLTDLGSLSIWPYKKQSGLFLF